MSSGREGMMVEYSVAVAVSFVWLGMVLAISFLEAPLKFRAPDVTPRIGLGIGRLVFRALNAVELVFAAALLVCTYNGGGSGRVVTAATVAAALLVVQLVAVRPALGRRSARVLAGEEPPRSHAHLAYVALELLKVVALLVAGVLLLSGG